MLKFLTHKLRTHSLNEDNVTEKVDEHDSGTESDDEIARPDSSEFCTDAIMKWNDVTDINMSPAECACSPTPQSPDTLYDHHSSEEELEVINGAPAEGESRRRGATSPPSAAPEKRKWTGMTLDSTRAPSSSDDDIKVETPVRFRTSPPLEALKPRRGRVSPCAGVAGAAGAGAACPCEPPHKQPHLLDHASPRRRPRHAPKRQRPALDFDKMQQLRVRGVTSWRHHGGSHGAGGELSVFCW